MTWSGHGTTCNEPVAGMAGEGAKGIPAFSCHSMMFPWRVRAIAPRPGVGRAERGAPRSGGGRGWGPVRERRRRHEIALVLRQSRRTREADRLHLEVGAQSFSAQF